MMPSRRAVLKTGHTFGQEALDPLLHRTRADAWAAAKASASARPRQRAAP